jgi:hypothetical protein
LDNEVKYVPHEVVRSIRELARNASSPYSDGFSACAYKHDLYVLKCFIEDMYNSCPEFPDQEREWEQIRLMELLKRK